VPKPLLPIANKPTIHYSIEALWDAGIREITVVTGHHAEVLEDALSRLSGDPVRFARQPEPRGLAHAVQCAEQSLGDEPFMLLLGDTLHDLPLAELRRQFEDLQADCVSVVAPVDNPKRYGIAVVEGERIVHLEEKPSDPRSNLAMAGAYVFGPAIWDVLVELRPSARGEMEITDAIHAMVEAGRAVYAFRFDGWWQDTGTLEGMLLANRYWMEKQGVRDALLGPGAQLDSCEAADYCSIGELAEARNGTLRNCILLPGVRVDLNGGTADSCLIGSDATFPRGGSVSLEVLG
jgi:glucose-1-phosphate thymidylyltransferase